MRGLLYYLAVQPRPVTRDQLIVLFWADDPEPYARRNLTRLLTHLRRALPDPDVLCVEGDRVSLKEGSFWCDVQKFGALIQKGAGAGDHIVQAAGLYSGPFLDGFSLPESLEFENWIARERGQYENRFLETLASLVNVCTLRQDYPAAIHYASRALEIDNLSEDMHRRLIALYALTGDRSRALRQYEDCVAVLERELGVAPLPETRQVYQSVLHGREVHAEDGHERAQPAWFRLLQSDIPLVGRNLALQRLAAAYLRAQSNKGHFVLIDGEPGIGKSRLLHDFAVSGQQQCPVLPVAGDRSAGKVPYCALVEAFRASPIPFPTTLSPVWVSELARLMPELSPEVRPPARRDSQSREEDRLRLFEALSRYIFALASEYNALILALDDLHWFDQASLQWLGFFSQQFQTRSSPVLVIGTYRSEDSERLEDLRNSLSRLHRLDEIHLEGLTVADIHAMLIQALGRQSGLERLAERLQGATGGNPFFLIETLRALGDEGRLGNDLYELVDLPIAEGVQATVNRRLGRLSARSRQVLEAAAVLGARFDFSPIRYTAGRNALETSGSLDDLVHKSLLLEDDDGYRFSHDLVRKAVAAALTPHRWRLLHLRAGQALEKYHPEAFAELAEHFDAGREWEKAIHYYKLAVDAAEALYAWQEAEEHLNRILTLLDHLDPAQTRSADLHRRSEILESLARLHAMQGRLAERDKDLQQVINLAENSHDSGLHLQACILQTRYLNQDGRYQEAVETAARGLVLAEQLHDTPSRYRLLAMSGFSYHFLGKPDMAMAAFINARAIEDHTIDLSMRAYVAVRLGFSHQRLGDYRRALAYQQEAHDYLVQKGDRNGAYEISIEVSFINANLGCFEEAEQGLLEALGHFRKHKLRPDEGHALLAYGGLQRLKGDYPGAVRLFTEALELLEPLRAAHITASAEAGLGFTYYQLGAYTLSRTWLERGLARARTAVQRIGTAESLIQLALVDLAEAQIDAARARLEEGLQIGREVQGGELLSAGMAARARLERASGCPVPAAEYGLAAAEQARQVGLTNLEMWGLTEAGLAFLEAANLNRAADVLAEAAALASRTVEDWLGTEYPRLAYARALAAGGEQTAADIQLSLAGTIIQTKAGYISDPDLRRGFLSQFS